MKDKKPLINRLNELESGGKIQDETELLRSGLSSIYSVPVTEASGHPEEQSEEEKPKAIEVLYGDRPELIERAASQQAEVVEAENIRPADCADEEISDESASGQITEIADNSIAAAREAAVAVRRIRENEPLKVNRFDMLFIKIWSYIVAFVVGISNGINWTVSLIFKKRLPDKYVRAFVAAVLIILLILLFTLPFSIEIKTDIELEIYSEGMLPVAESVYIDGVKYQRWGFVNDKGKLVIKAEYEEVMPFRHGVAWVRTLNRDTHEDYWFLIDKKGKPVGKDVLKFSTMPTIERPVGEFPKDVKLAWVYTAGKYGFVKSNGTYAITPRYDYAETYSCGLARVRMGSIEYFINKNGNQVGTLFNEVMSFSEDLGAVMTNGIWGFMNKNGDLVIEPQYNAVSKFKGGYAAVRNGEAYGIIDKKGKSVVDPINYTDILPLSPEFMELIDSIRL